MVRFAEKLIAISAISLTAGAAGAQTPALSNSSDRVMAVAEAAQLSAEIAIADQSGPIHDRVIGMANLQSQLPIRVGDRWLWASVTKQVTAVLVMQQVESGRLSLDGTIRSYLPEFAGSGGDRVTVRQLLRHQSGLPNPDDTMSDSAGIPSFYQERGGQIGDTARANGYCAGPSVVQDGSTFSYNNCDYLVLGAILERVTGKAYGKLVQERIASPLHLKSLTVLSDGTERADAIGYTAGGNRYPSINVATFGAAGALTGTAEDLISFNRALLTGKLLEPGTRDLLWQGDPALGYEALGAWSFPAQLAGCDGPVNLIERRGDVAGIQVRNVIAPDLQRSIALFTNDDTVDFGEVWQGKGLSYDLLSAAFCPAQKP